MYGLISVILIFSPIPVFCGDGPIVNTPLGRILGTIQKSRKGIDFYSFRGIRYADPPVGDLRFKPPIPTKPWDDLYDATADGPICYQPYLEPLSEDCLRLNVYTRHINSDNESRPVLIYFHGGGFAIYTGRSDWHGPEYIMDHDVVFVTTNYRLGTLGCFSTGDSYAPGNYGMKDQVEVLRWIQKNIRSFGGDPSRVTISGESAGAASVGHHLSSPISRGLFHGAILLSGSSLDPWAMDRNPTATAKKQAALLNCPTNTSLDMVECMKKVPAEDIAKILLKLTDWNHDPHILIRPVVESEDYGIERFLTKDPLVSLKEGDIANVPVMIGTTKDEFAYKALAKVLNKKLAADMSSNWTKLAPISFMYEPNDKISNRLREYYLGSMNQPITYDSFDGLANLYADSIITFGVVRAAKLLAEKNVKPVYLYQFNYKGEYSNADGESSVPITNLTNMIHHGDDLVYTFFTKVFKRVMFNATGEYGKMVDKWTTLLINFVETGNPTPERSDLLDNVTWAPLKNANPSYLDVNKTLTMRNGMYYEDRMSLWETLFPL